MNRDNINYSLKSGCFFICFIILVDIFSPLQSIMMLFFCFFAVIFCLPKKSKMYRGPQVIDIGLLGGALFISAVTAMISMPNVYWWVINVGLWGVLSAWKIHKTSIQQQRSKRAAGAELVVPASLLVLVFLMIINLYK